MLGWSAPLALLSLLVVLPWLRWLHRRRDSELELRVPAIFLWGANEAETKERPRANDPDPIWWLRAAIAALAVMAIAGPTLEREGTREIDVYMDDAASMQVRESGQTRLAIASDMLTAQLASTSARAVRLISLGRPTRILELGPAGTQYDAAAMRRRIDGWGALVEERRALPGRSQLRAGVEHWLVTDGTDPAVLAWTKTVPLDRVIEVGRTSENVGVVHLAARRSALDPNALQGIVRVANGGARATVRSLEVRSGDERLLLVEALELAPGTAVERTFSGPIAAPVTASIDPADALPEDDLLALDTAIATAVQVDLDDACGSFLRAALDAHPGLHLGAAGTRVSEPDLRVVCTTAPPAPGPPTIWIPPEAAGVRSGPPHRPAAAEDALASDFVEETNPGVLEVKVDLAAAEWVRQLEYPALVSALVDRALGRELLDWSASSSRGDGGIGSARIAPARIAAHVADDGRAASDGSAVVKQDLSGSLIALAALLLLMDAGWGWRPS